MSGMDRLTDEKLAQLAHAPWTTRQAATASMARELLAHRRTSQAAPAPVAWLWERGGDRELTLRNDGVHGPRLALNGFTAHPLYRAPAPSDGLREENERLRSFIADFAGNRFERIERRVQDPQDDLDPVTDWNAIDAWQDDARAVLEVKT